MGIVFVVAPSMVLAGEAVAESGGEGVSMVHRMMILALQLGVIVLAARVGNMLFTRLNLPGVVGELMTGVLIGPYVLGALPLPGFPHGFFHVHESIASGAIPVSPELYGICSIASIVLLFLVGLETDIGMFMRYSLAGSAVGIGGVLVSFLMGDLMVMLFSPMLFNEQLGFFDAPCLFLGIVSTATSVGISARILSEKRKLDSPEGVTILAGAVIDDVLGMILLAIGMGVISASKGGGGIDWGYIGIIAFKAVFVWLTATAVGLLVARKISTLLKWFGDRSVIAVMALALAFILAGLFEEAGLAMIIGAYVMGLSLSRTDLSHVIQEKLHPLHVFLVPVFFTVMGMLVDVRVLMSKDVLLFGMLYTAIAMGSKIVGCGLPALFVNFNMRGALRIGVGMLPRGEVTLLIAGTGLAAGLLNPKIFGIIVFMTFCAALASPPLLVKLFSNAASGVRNPVQDDKKSELVFGFPSMMVTELLVGKLLNVFEDEGFFVHTLSREDRLYQLRKENVVISFQQRENDVVFDVGESEIAFINTAMLEVVVDLERTVKELRKPLNLKELSRRVQDEASDAPQTSEHVSEISRYIKRELLAVHLAGSTKQEVITELLELLKRHGDISDLDQARQAVLEREETMSTGMQFGIAMPHGRTDAVSELVCAVGLKPEGLDFDALDGQPSRIFVMALSPVSAAAGHMQFMARISRFLNEQGRRALLACDNEDEMFQVLSGKVGNPRQSAMLSLLQKENRLLLSEFMQPEQLLPDLTADTKEGVIEELLGVLAKCGKITDVAGIRDEVMAREKQMSTGMEHGIAIPHARTNAVDQLVCAIGIHRSGVDYDALDGKPSRIFVLTLTPADAGSLHIKFMAMISRLLNDVGREKVLNANGRDELWKVLTG